MQNQPAEMISSPIRQKQDSEFKLLSTPETNKGKTVTQPMKYSRIKKSKRRDCTPVYSPPQITEPSNKENFRFYTDKKGNYTFGKLNFESELKLFQPSTQYKADKSNFLELVEESLNEFNGTILEGMGNQITPDTIFTTLFNDSKENPEKLIQNTPQATLTEIKKAFSEIDVICNSLIKGDMSSIKEMKPKVMIIDSQCNFKETSFSKFEKNLIALVINQKNTSPMKDNKVFVMGKAQLAVDFIEGKKDSMTGCDSKSVCRDMRLIFNIEKTVNIKLVCIEIHWF